MSVKKYLDFRELFLVFSKSIIVLLSIGFCIVLAGVILEIFGRNTALERSGSLLVCYALFCFYVNHHTDSLVDGLKELSSSKTGFESSVSEEDLRKVLLKHKVADAVIAEMVENFPEAVRQLKSEYKPLISKKKNLTTSEITMGVMGTFIWGFGDILADFMMAAIT